MNAETVSRVGSGIALPMALLLVIFFFLPWLNVNCSMMSFAEASGWQLTVGDLSPTGMVKEDMEKKGEKEKDEDMPDARPWFILGLLAPAVMLVVAALGVAGRINFRNCGFLLIALAVIGILVIILAANVEYSELPQKMKSASQPSSTNNTSIKIGPSNDDMAKMAATQINTSCTGILWWSLAFYVMLVVCGGVVLMSPLLAHAIAAVIRANAAAPGSPPSAGPPVA